MDLTMLCIRELFSDENRLRPAVVTCQSTSNSFGFLAMAKAHVAKCHMEQAADNNQGMCFAVFWV
jgi:hypothetical protein